MGFGAQRASDRNRRACARVSVAPYRDPGVLDLLGHAPAAIARLRRIPGQKDRSAATQAGRGGAAATAGRRGGRAGRCYRDFPQPYRQRGVRLRQGESLGGWSPTSVQPLEVTLKQKSGAGAAAVGCSGRSRALPGSRLILRVLRQARHAGDERIVVRPLSRSHIAKERRVGRTLSTASRDQAAYVLIGPGRPAGLA